MANIFGTSDGTVLRVDSGVGRALTRQSLILVSGGKSTPKYTQHNVITLQTLAFNKTSQLLDTSVSSNKQGVMGFDVVRNYSV